MTFTANSIHPSRGGHVVEIIVALLPFFLRLSSENHLVDFPSQSRDKLIDRTLDKLSSIEFLLSGRFFHGRVSNSLLTPFFSSPYASSSFHPRNQKRSPPEQFYPFVGINGRVQPENQATTLPLPILPPTIPRPVRPRELLPPRSSR